MSKAKNEADAQRAEAKRLLNLAFRIPEDVHSNLVDAAVDCIISAALLECAALMHEANKSE